jgi:hypothetical protein
MLDVKKGSRKEWFFMNVERLAGTFAARWSVQELG